MGRRGRKRRLGLESEYWRLVGSGVGTVDACKQLGIGRKTGYRWRAENGGLPPAALSEGVRTDRFLSLLERQRVANLRRDGLGVRAIALELGRSPSTVSRELRRNTAVHDRNYDGDLAHARARERARRPRRGRLTVELYLGGRGGLRRELTKRLRTGRPLRRRRRRRRRSTTERRPRFVTPGRLIRATRDRERPHPAR